jgi:hypothetical protein
MADVRLNEHNIRILGGLGNDDLHEVSIIREKPQIIEFHNAKTGDLCEGFEIPGLCPPNMAPWSWPRDSNQGRNQCGWQSAAQSLLRPDAGPLEMARPPPKTCGRHGTPVGV